MQEYGTTYYKTGIDGDEPAEIHPSVPMKHPLWVRAHDYNPPPTRDRCLSRSIADRGDTSGRQASMRLLGDELLQVANRAAAVPLEDLA